MSEEKPFLHRVIIEGLHGDKSVTLQFRDRVTIMMTENGIGKTTILNILYYILDQKLKRLSAVNFRSVRLELSDNVTTFEINREELEGYGIEGTKHRLPPSARRMLEAIEQQIDTESITSIMLASRTGDISEVRKVIRKHAVPHGSEVALANILRYVTEFPDVLNQILLKKRLNEFLRYFPYKLVYLPTYRRVEEDLANLGIMDITQTDDLDWEDISTRDDVLIHFGMKDVGERFKRVTQKIKDDTMASYSKISGSMLDELLRMPTFSNDSAPLDYLRQNEDGLTLVLKRIGSSISEAGRTQILNLVNTGQVSAQQYQPLAYFLGNLIKIYEAQKGFDEKINKFIKTVNTYLNDKKLIYDEVDPKIFISSMRSDKEIDLETLSSGEKQLISILSLLYLEENEYAVIFDEPELSLSTGWQQKLLPDLMASGSCKFLLAATHSPFIFDNEYVAHAKPIQIQYEARYDDAAS